MIDGTTLPQLPEQMKRYCVKCRTEISSKRTTRGSFFCGENNDRCRIEDKKARRAYKASKDCALCGRKARKKPQRQKVNQKAPSAPATGASADLDQVQTLDVACEPVGGSVVVTEAISGVNQ
jgi:hypothetical protein